MRGMHGVYTDDASEEDILHKRRREIGETMIEHELRKFLVARSGQAWEEEDIQEVCDLVVASEEQQCEYAYESGYKAAWSKLKRAIDEAEYE